jgi:hypothetical protein
VTGDEAVRRICDQLEAEGVDTGAATSLSFVTWEEIVRTVVTAAGQAAVFDVKWPAE